MPNAHDCTPVTSQGNRLILAVKSVCDWLERGSCILFLGAAFSARDPNKPNKGGAPSTAELLKEFQKERGVQGNKALREILEQFSNHPGGLARYLVDRFTSGRITGDHPIKPKNIHHLVARLPFHTVITTNCDDLMEVAYQNIWKEVDRIIVDEDLPAVFGKGVNLVKPHGCVREALSQKCIDDSFFVFTDSQYRNFEQGRPFLTKWLTAIMATHNILFIGYGLNDGNILELISGARKANEKVLNRRMDAEWGGIWWSVMGDTHEPGFERFEILLNIHRLNVGAEEFMERLNREFSQAHLMNYDFLRNESFLNTPDRFKLNCCVASIFEPFPIELLKWRLTPKDEEKAQPFFQELYSKGFLEPKMTNEGQWYKFHRSVKEFFHVNDSGTRTREALIEDYKQFLSS